MTKKMKMRHLKEEKEIILEVVGLKLNYNLKKEGTPKIVKRNKTIKPELFNFHDSKKTNNVFSVRKEKENLVNKKKSNCMNIEEVKNNNEKKGN